MVSFTSSTLVVTFVSLLILTSASPRKFPDYIDPDNGNCKDFNISKTITWSAQEWTKPELHDNYEVTALLGSVALHPETPRFALTEIKTETFELSVTFCAPKQLGPNSRKVLVATHGVGFDRRYWAPAFDDSDTYNFVKTMLGAGYPVLYYDRLGVGKSQRYSGYKISPNMQVELLAKLLSGIMEGYHTPGLRASMVIPVGHSFGSLLVQQLVAKYPQLMSNAVLTSPPGPTQTRPFIETVWAARLANQFPETTAPQYATTYDTGYFSFLDVYAYSAAFLAFPGTPKAAALGSYAATQPHAVGESLGQAAGLPAHNSTNYKGRMLIVAGELDFTCDRNCSRAYAGDYGQRAYPSAAEVKVYVHPGAAHAANYVSTAQAFFEVIIDFLNKA